MTSCVKSLGVDMDSYYTQPSVVEAFVDQNGNRHDIVKARQLENFKLYMEAHVATLTAGVQQLQAHVNWIEPRLNDYHRFMEWMQRVHPDVITAYTEATKVEQVLDKANDEMIYPQGVQV